jgi:hypothetical protein
MTTKNGGAAFPTSYDGGDDGMTLRDYFAGQAMLGLLSANTPTPTDDPHRVIAIGAYLVADAMLAERER